MTNVDEHKAGSVETLRLDESLKTGGPETPNAKVVFTPDVSTRKKRPRR